MSNYKKLGDISILKTGPFGTQLKASEYVDEGVPVINVKNIGYGNLIYSGIEHITEETRIRLKEHTLKTGDIVFGRKGSVDRHCLITERENGWFQGSDCLRVRIVDENVSPEYVSYFLLCDHVLKGINNAAVGSTMASINMDIISEIPVLLPPYTEQCKIAHTLKAIDSKIEVNNRINDNLQQMAKTLYDYWFTQFDFPNEDGKPYRTAGGQMVWNEQLKREIPIGWSVRKLSDILRKNTKAFDYLTPQPAIDLSVMPSNSIALSKLNTSDSFTTNLFEMKRGDILFGSIRPYLHKAGIAPCDGVVAGTIHSYRVKNSRDYNFALITLARDIFFDYAVNVSSGTKMPVVSSDSILAYQVPYDTVVVEKFNNIALMETITQNVQENQKLMALRDWLLPMLMNGQATISD
jgi:type I restriction enzyme S subunit